MKYGVVMFPTDYSIDPVSARRRRSRRAASSRSSSRSTRTSRRAGGRRGRAARTCRRSTRTRYDPFVALTAAAIACTEAARRAPAICLVMERDPITTAKEVASVDLLSDGRFIFGVGGGWNEEEMENHGTDPTRRFKVMRERIEAMKEIWTKDEAEYHGEFVNFDPIWSWPKPVQKPHPPIYVGGDGAHTLKRVIEYGDGWMPIPGRGADIGNRMKELQAMAADAGRGPIPVTVLRRDGPRAEVIQHYADDRRRPLHLLAPVGASGRGDAKTGAVFGVDEGDRDGGSLENENQTEV